MSYINIPFVKYGSIEEIISNKAIKKVLQSDVEIFEKIDGGNCQVRKHQGKLLAGSKANFLTGPVLDKVEWFSIFNGWMHSNPSLYSLPEDIILFGEWGGHHTIQYDRKNIDRFFVIDVLDLNDKRFMPYAAGQSFLQSAGIMDVDFVKPLFRGKPDQSLLVDLLISPSAYYSGRKEGLVIKDYQLDPQKFYKILNAGFKEKREKLFGKIDPFTEARFRKNLLAALEETGMCLKVDQLYEFVKQDVLNETGKEYDLDYIRKKMLPYLSKVAEREGLIFKQNPKL